MADFNAEIALCQTDQMQATFLNDAGVPTPILCILLGSKSVDPHVFPGPRACLGRISTLKSQ